MRAAAPRRSSIAPFNSLRREPTAGASLSVPDDSSTRFNWLRHKYVRSISYLHVLVACSKVRPEDDHWARASLCSRNTCTWRSLKDNTRSIALLPLLICLLCCSNKFPEDTEDGNTFLGINHFDNGNLIVLLCVPAFVDVGMMNDFGITLGRCRKCLDWSSAGCLLAALPSDNGLGLYERTG